MDINKTTKLLYSCILALALVGCGSDSDSDNNAGPAEDNKTDNPSKNSTPPKVKSDSGVAVYGDYDKNKFKDASDENGKKILLLDDETQDAGYAALGMNLKEILDGQPESVAKMAKASNGASQSSNKLDEQSEKYLAKIQKALEDGATVNLLSKQASQNGQSKVVKITLSISFDDAGTSNSPSAIREAVLLAANDGFAPNEAGEGNYGQGDKIILDLTFWLDPKADVVYMWSGAYLDSHTQKVRQQYNDLRTGTALTTEGTTTTVAKQEAFEQKEGNTGGVDILWSIDASGSMSQEQENLANGAEQFFTSLNAAGVDYRLAVNTQGRDRGPDSYNCTGLRAIEKDTPEEADKFFIDSQTADAADKWKALAQPGTGDSGTETGFYCVREVELGAFDRAAAKNLVVFVSDEEENETYSEYRPYEADYNTYTKRSFNDYKTYFDGTGATYFAIVGTAEQVRVDFDQSAPRSNDPDYRCNGDGGSAEGGAHFKEIAKVTGGSSASICADSEDWKIMFDSIIETATGLASNFVLEHAPIPSTVSVKVNGAEVARDLSRQDGFDVIYGQDDASLIFYGDSSPEASDAINISYEYLSN